MRHCNSNYGLGCYTQDGLLRHGRALFRGRHQDSCSAVTSFHDTFNVLSKSALKAVMLPLQPLNWSRLMSKLKRALSSSVSRITQGKYLIKDGGISVGKSLLCSSLYSWSESASISCHSFLMPVRLWERSHILQLLFSNILPKR